MSCFEPNVINKRTGAFLGPHFLGQRLRPFERKVACQKCEGCRMAQAKDWTLRCHHEQNMKKEQGLGSQFLTLTYADHNLPPEHEYRGTVYPKGSLCLPDHQSFTGILKKRLQRQKHPRMSYFMCGEYGALLQRPHFHYIIFGYEYPDLKPWKVIRGNQYYTSEELSDQWKFGHAVISEVTPASIAYVCRYVLKKQTGTAAEEHYKSLCGLKLHPEFTRMSKRPAIGETWFQKYGRSDIYDSGGFAVLDGIRMATPRFYDRLLEKMDEPKLLEIKKRRELAQHKKKADNTPARLETRRECFNLRLRRLKRGYEEHGPEQFTESW